jgi:hypothetical protein
VSSVIAFPSKSSAITFPKNPNVGDQFLAKNGSVYKWDGTVWEGLYTNPRSTIPLKVETKGPQK